MNKVLKVLNDALEADPTAIRALFNATTICNDKLGNTKLIVGEDQGHEVIRPMGLLNGVVEELTGMRVASMHDDTGNLIKFAAYDVQKQKIV